MGSSCGGVAFQRVDTISENEFADVVTQALATLFPHFRCWLLDERSSTLGEHLLQPSFRLIVIFIKVRPRRSLPNTS
jgi:hypothetical protein